MQRCVTVHVPLCAIVRLARGKRYLLLKGVEAVSIHGGKDQDERNEAIARFKDTSKDVLVATDIASRGLDVPETSHIVLFDMPPSAES